MENVHDEGGVPGAVTDSAEKAGESTGEEHVLQGLAFASLGVVLGVIATVVVWRLGFLAAITSLVLAAAAAYLYGMGAGAPPRRGVPALVALIVVGVVVSFFAVIASDAWDAYDLYDIYGATGESRRAFLREVLFDGDVLSSYGGEMAMFAIMAALGTFGTLRTLTRPQRPGGADASVAGPAAG